LVWLATMVVAGDAPGTAEASSQLPVPAAPAATPQMRLAVVQRAMQEQGIDFRPTVQLGDDGRIVCRVVWVDTRGETAITSSQ
jgi:hypothetical protein